MEIRNYEQLKVLFQLCQESILISIEYYQLDGFVSDHIRLKQSYSKIYHYLTIFDILNDPQKVFVLENKRIDILQPLMKQINYKTYHHFHQEVSLITCTSILV